MSNLSDKHYFQPTNLDKSTHSTTVKKSGLFADKNTGFEHSFLNNTTNPSTFSGMLPSQSSGCFQLNQTFKIPNFDSLPAKKSISNVRSVNPRQSVKPNMVRNGLKQSQQSKISLIPRPSFIISRKSLHGSRSAQRNARKELLKQMVFLHEYGSKERKEVKISTPVKTLAGLTPKKTPRSGGYFVLPEFNKKLPKLEDIRSPLQDLVKKEMFGYSAKPTPLSEKKVPLSTKKSERKTFQPDNELTSNFIIRPKEINMEIQKFPNQRARFSALLNKIKIYNREVSEIHEKLHIIDNTFINKITDLPDYRVYNEFCFYKSKKEDLYLKLQNLETEFTNYASAHTRIGKELEAYIKKKQEVFESHKSLHKGFEKAVSSALEECGENKIEEKNEVAQEKAESPKLRRSLRLSKIKKNKFEEKSPVSKKLRKLDTKSRGIQKA